MAAVDNPRSRPVTPFQSANLRALVHLRPITIRVRARDVTKDQRHWLWPAFTAVSEYFDAYQVRTSGCIPMVILSPA